MEASTQIARYSIEDQTVVLRYLYPNSGTNHRGSHQIRIYRKSHADVGSYWNQRSYYSKDAQRAIEGFRLLTQKGWEEFVKFWWPKHYPVMKQNGLL